MPLSGYLLRVKEYLSSNSSPASITPEDISALEQLSSQESNDRILDLIITGNLNSAPDYLYLERLAS